ncbi:MAG TPA: AbrB/MazE/SpoVT family DNA-binding domain-containing protein [Candidatus Sulfotelmatobacter sp.]|nr:AbrB/MazE/SpoVT family DNA-binding domain-containing protein [Candidatus Sulfotelmatobacter sp.]
MHRSTISTKGRITIPAELRQRLGLKPGTSVNWSKQDGGIVLTAVAVPKKSAKPAGAGRKRPLATGH